MTTIKGARRPARTRVGTNAATSSISTRNASSRRNIPPADSLPATALEAVGETAANDTERRQYFDAVIDSGRGSCVLRDADNAAIVRDAPKHFDGQRYRLLAWVVMPNHVHVMIERMEGHRLGDVVHAWKSFTAKAINRCMGSSGILRAPDYFDRFVRDEAH